MTRLRWCGSWAWARASAIRRRTSCSRKRSGSTILIARKVSRVRSRASQTTPKAPFPRHCRNSNPFSFGLCGVKRDSSDHVSVSERPWPGDKGRLYPKDVRGWKQLRPGPGRYCGCPSAGANWRGVSLTDKGAPEKRGGERAVAIRLPSQSLQDAARVRVTSGEPAAFLREKARGCRAGGRPGGNLQRP